MRYVVNQLSVLLLDSDKAKGFNTVAYDYQNDTIMAIRPKEYSILKYISDSRGVSSENLDQVSLALQINTTNVEKIIADLVNKSILEQND